MAAGTSVKSLAFRVLERSGVSFQRVPTPVNTQVEHAVEQTVEQGATIARVRGHQFAIKTAKAEICWHCQGEKLCQCALCAIATAEIARWQPGECGACKGTGFLCWPEKLQ